METCTRFVAEYVRRVSRDPVKKKRVLDALKRGQPHCERQFMAVVMIDISGYSKLTSLLSAKGKISSELITESIGAYMQKITHILELYRGDVVKFLGDAVLVTFESEGPKDVPETVITRAVTCSLHIALRYPIVDFHARIMQAHEAMGSISQQHDDPKIMPDAFELKLHIAVTAGEIDRVIVGTSDRMDYFVTGYCLNELGNTLDRTKSGEIGLNHEAVALMAPDMRDYLVNLENMPASPSDVILGADKLKSAFGEFCKSFSGSIPKPGEDDETIAFAVIGSVRSWPSESAAPDFAYDYGFLELFINQSIVARIKAAVRSANFDPASADVTADYSANVVKGQIIDPSSMKKMLHFEGEFRSLTIVFVEIDPRLDLQSVQYFTATFLNALERHGGFFHQFSADDKGKTLLAIFGLPPTNHPNNPEQCIRAMADFVSSLRPEERGIEVGIASGMLLVTAIGNDVRSDAGFLGDTVNMSARLLMVSRKHHLVAVDNNSYETTKHLFPYVDIGKEFIKGKTAEVKVWGLDLSADINVAGAVKKSLHFGYPEERGKIMAKYEQWIKNAAGCVIVIEGKSGFGKTNFIKFMENLTADNNVQFCITQGNEMDRLSPFHGLRVIVAHIISKLLPKRHGGRGDRSRTSKTSSSIDILRRSSNTGSAIHASLKGSLGGSLWDNTQRQEYQEMYKVLFTSCGVPVDLLPLLGIISPDYKFEETPRTTALDNAGRLAVLHDLLINLIIQFAASERTFFVVDDCQWLDSNSMNVFASLAQSNKKIALMCITRPLSESASEAMCKILRAPEILHIPLTGISKDDTRALIVTKIRNDMFEIETIQEELIDAIYLWSEGSPLLADMVSEYLATRIGSDLVLTNDRVLAVNNWSINSNDVISALDLSAIVLFQFDQLCSDMQVILKNAALLGQYFSLEDVIQVGMLEMSVEHAVACIDANDRYSFLLRDSDDTSGINLYSFRHIAITNVIYESFSYAERLLKNVKAAKYLEDALTAENREILLPRICFYYCRTSESKKIIEYREELGCRHIMSSMYVEGNEHLQALIKYVDGSRELFDEDLARSLTPNRIATWHSYLMTGLNFASKVVEAKMAAISVFSIALGMPWPSKSEDFKRINASLRMKIAGLWIKTFAGRFRQGQNATVHPGSTSQLCLGSNAVIVRTVIELTKFSYGFDEVFSFDEKFHMIGSALVACLLGYSTLDDFSMMLTSLAYYGAPGKFGRIISRITLKKAMNIMLSNANRYAAIPLCLFGKKDECLSLTKYAIEVVTKNYDGRNIVYTIVSLVFLGSMLALYGDLENAEMREIPMFLSDEKLKMEFAPSVTVSSSAIFTLLLKYGSTESTEMWFSSLNIYANLVPIFPALYATIAAFYYLIKGDLTSALQAFSKASIELQSRAEDSYFYTECTILWRVSIYSSLLADPSKSGIESLAGKRWSKEERDELLVAMRNFHKVATIIGSRCNYIIGRWSAATFEANCLILEGKSAIICKRLLPYVVGFRRKEFQQCPLTFGLIKGLISRYSSVSALRSKLHDEADEIFGRSKAMALQKWNSST